MSWESPPRPEFGPVRSPAPDCEPADEPVDDGGDVVAVVEEEADDGEEEPPELVPDPSPGKGPVWSAHGVGSGPSAWFNTWSRTPQGPMTPNVLVSDVGLTKMFPHGTGVEPL
jgi:hypothetical protein